MLLSYLQYLFQQTGLTDIQNHLFSGEINKTLNQESATLFKAAFTVHFPKLPRAEVPAKFTRLSQESTVCVEQILQSHTNSFYLPMHWPALWRLTIQIFLHGKDVLLPLYDIKFYCIWVILTFDNYFLSNSNHQRPKLVKYKITHFKLVSMSYLPFQRK